MTPPKAPRARRTPQNDREWASALQDDPDALAGLLRALVAAHGAVEPTAEGLHDLVSPKRVEKDSD